MYKLLFALFGCFLLAANFSFAQNNEGFIKLKLRDAQQKTQLVTWYFKGNKLASEIETRDADNQPARLKILFDLPTQSLIIYYPNATQPLKVSANNIALDKSLSQNYNYSELGRGNTEPRFKQNVDMQILHGEYTTTAAYTTDLPFDWALYKDFLKQDPTFYAMSKEGLKGFPYLASTKDKAGNIITEFQLIEFKLARIDDKIFQK